MFNFNIAVFVAVGSDNGGHVCFSLVVSVSVVVCCFHPKCWHTCNGGGTQLLLSIYWHLALPTLKNLHYSCAQYYCCITHVAFLVEKSFIFCWIFYLFMHLYHKQSGKQYDTMINTEIDRPFTVMRLKWISINYAIKMTFLLSEYLNRKRLCYEKKILLLSQYAKRTSIWYQI